jgi:hypothetical protein
VAADDALVEFTLGSIDGGVHSREAIRHYSITKDAVKRVDPLALSPRDFVEEWIGTDWREGAHWSEDANRRSMLQWHDKLKKVTGELFIQPCTAGPAPICGKWALAIRMYLPGRSRPARTSWFDGVRRTGSEWSR